MPSIKAQSRFYVNPYMWFVIFFVFFFLLYLLRSVLMPFVAGILLAYLLDPLTLKLQKCKNVTDMGYGAGLLFDDFNRSAGNIFIFRDG